MAAPILALESVSKTYKRARFIGSKRIPGIVSLNLSVNPGEAFGLLGLNGSGKTTTFKLILGLLAPDDGKISLFGSVPSDAEARGRVGYLPELPSFYPYLSVRDHLRFYGRLSNLSRARLEKRIEEVLLLVGLKGQERRTIKELSKGFAQRVGLAQAFLHDPDLLILDEPASGLDPLAIRELRDLLSRLNAAGKTILISSHSISEVEKICHRAAVLREGRLARTIERSEWMGFPEGLEGLFVDCIK